MTISKEERRKVLEKVQKLLALAESANEHEAALAASRAKSILDKYNLTLSEVEIKEIEENKLNTGAVQVQKWELALAAYVAKTFNCSTYYCQGYRKTQATVTFVGSTADVEVAEYIYYYLANTIKRMTTEHIRSLGIPNHACHATMHLSPAAYKRRHRLSFAHGIVNTLADKLEAMAKKTEQENADVKTASGLTGKEIIVIKKDAIADHMAGLSLLTSKSRPTTVMGDSYSSGKDAGKGINIRTGLNGGEGQKAIG